MGDSVMQSVVEMLDSALGAAYHCGRAGEQQWNDAVWTERNSLLRSLAVLAGKEESRRWLETVGAPDASALASAEPGSEEGR